MIPRAVPLPDAPNVLLVVIDTLRADHVGCYGYGRETTPAIDRLAAEGAVFETAISQAPWTGASVATLLTGLYPSVHGLDRGARWEDGPSAGRQLPFLLQRTLDPSVPTLASTLRRSGYRTACVPNGRFCPRKRCLNLSSQSVSPAARRRIAVAEEVHHVTEAHRPV